jgi:XTP/dITP diphosphohydrolase
MKDIIFTTHNSHKIIELKALFASLPSPLKFLEDYPPFPPAVEDKDTFEENAEKKALHTANHLGCISLADDSGLEVDALGGRPGIHSARYAPTNHERIARLLHELKEVPEEKRTARFTCSIAIGFPGGKVITKTGHCYGSIIFKARGQGGFGYDPVFLVKNSDKTMAELSFEKKNQISHRANASKMILPLLLDIINTPDKKSL